MARHIRRNPNADEFTPAELLAAQKALRRKYLPKSDNIVEIGFGQALLRSKEAKAAKLSIKPKSGSAKPRKLPSPHRSDPKRTFCVKFFVKRKWKSRPLSRADLIPREVEFTIVRRGKRLEFVMSTDVIRYYVPRLTGAKVRVPGDDATSGIAVRWREKNAGATVFWAIITVGHLFYGLGSGTAAGINFKGNAFSGTLMGKATDAEKIDGAVLEVFGQDLIDAGVVSSPTATATVLSLNQLGTLYGVSGRSLRDPSARQIEYRTLFPDTQNFPTLGDRLFVVEAWSDTTNCFQGGTSGSAWSRLTAGAAVQIGGTQGIQYRQGFAQAATTVLSWAELFIKSNRQVTAGSFAIAAIF